MIKYYSYRTKVMENLKVFQSRKEQKVSKAQIDFWIASSQKAQKNFLKKFEKSLDKRF